MNKDLILSVKLFFLWILMLLVFVILGGVLFGDLKSMQILDLGNWDGVHFIDIAKRGYQERMDYAFFPLYPLIINLVSKFLNISFFLSATLINLFSTFGVIYVFIRLLRELKEKNVERTLIYFLIFPTSFYLIAAYSESIFLLFTLLTFYMAFRKKLFWGIIFSGLASSARIVGIAAALGFVIEVFSSRNISKKVFVIFSVSGLLMYCFYLLLVSGNPLFFLVSELNWDRVLTVPGRNIWFTTLYLAHYGLDTIYYTIFLDLLFAIFGIGLGLRTVRFLKPSLYSYTLLCLLIPFTTSILLSFPRFLIVVFPLFILIGRIKSKVFQISYIVVCLTLLFIFFNLFLREIWVS